MRSRAAIHEFEVSPRKGGSRWPHVIIAGLVAAYSMFSYFHAFQTNPITGESQRISMSPKQEIAMGRQAAPQLISQHGGLDPDETQQNRVERIGQEIVTKALGDENPYPFGFHVLRNDRAVNAFALPGGQVFVTAGLLNQLKTEGQVAGVLAHEIAHVARRHAAERLAKTNFTEGLTGALIISAYDPDNPKSQKAAQVALALSQLIQMKYGREDELESDRDGVHFMAKAGYDPRTLISVIEILRASASGGTPEFFSTHPSPDQRIERIEYAITELFPDDVPETLKP